MRAIWNGFISFGLVTIPVSVGLAQQRSDVSFRTLARATGQPVKQKRWDPVNDAIHQALSAITLADMQEAAIPRAFRVPARAAAASTATANVLPAE